MSLFEKKTDKIKSNKEADIKVKVCNKVDKITRAMPIECITCTDRQMGNCSVYKANDELMA